MLTAAPALPAPNFAVVETVPMESSQSALDRLFDGALDALPVPSESLAPAPIPEPRTRSRSRAADGLAAGAVLLGFKASAYAAPHAVESWVSTGSDLSILALMAAALAVAGGLVYSGYKRWVSRTTASPPRPFFTTAFRRVLAAGLFGALSLRVGDSACPSPASILKRPKGVKATPFEQRDILVDGMRLRYIDEGEGPVLLLLPGLTSRVEEFDAMTEQLKGKFRVLALDLPGSGYSDKPDRPYSLEFYEDTILAFLDRLGIEKCFLAGGSLGGNLTLRLAHRSPERFPRVAAWAPAGSWAPKPIVGRMGHAIGGFLTFWPTVKAQSSYWYSPDFPGREAALKETFLYYDEIMSPGFVRMYWDLATEQLGTSLQGIAPEIRQPTLLLWGDRDDGGGMAAGVARLHELIPNSKLVVFPDARHSLTAERPQELVDAIESFLTQQAD